MFRKLKAVLELLNLKNIKVTPIKRTATANYKKECKQTHIPSHIIQTEQTPARIYLEDDIL